MKHLKTIQLFLVFTLMCLLACQSPVVQAPKGTDSALSENGSFSIKAEGDSLQCLEVDKKESEASVYILAYAVEKDNRQEQSVIRYHDDAVATADISYSNNTLKIKDLTFKISLTGKLNKVYQTDTLTMGDLSASVPELVEGSVIHFAPKQLEVHRERYRYYWKSGVIDYDDIEWEITYSVSVAQTLISARIKNGVFYLNLERPRLRRAPGSRLEALEASARFKIASTFSLEADKSSFDPLNEDSIKFTVGGICPGKNGELKLSGPVLGYDGAPTGSCTRSFTVVNGETSWDGTCLVDGETAFAAGSWNAELSQEGGKPINLSVTSTSEAPGSGPSGDPSSDPSGDPSSNPSSEPSSDPSSNPSSEPSSDPSSNPSSEPSSDPSSNPSSEPSSDPSSNPSSDPSGDPSPSPSDGSCPAEMSPNNNVVLDQSIDAVSDLLSDIPPEVFQKLNQIDRSQQGFRTQALGSDIQGKIRQLEKALDNLKGAQTIKEHIDRAKIVEEHAINLKLSLVNIDYKKLGIIIGTQAARVVNVVGTVAALAETAAGLYHDVGLVCQTTADNQSFRLATAGLNSWLTSVRPILRRLQKVDCIRYADLDLTQSRLNGLVSQLQDITQYVVNGLNHLRDSESQAARDDFQKANDHARNVSSTHTNLLASINQDCQKPCERGEEYLGDAGNGWAVCLHPHGRRGANDDKIDVLSVVRSAINNDELYDDLDEYRDVFLASRGYEKYNAVLGEPDTDHKEILILSAFQLSQKNLDWRLDGREPVKWADKEANPYK